MKTVGFYICLVAISAARADQLALVKLPGYVVLKQSKEGSVLSNEVSAAIKGISGLPSLEKMEDIDLKLSGLKVPKVLIFLQAEALQASSLFQMLNVEGDINLGPIVSEISNFYGDNANYYEVNNEQHDGDTQTILREIIEVAKASISSSQRGPTLLLSSSLGSSSDLPNLLSKFSEDLAASFGEDVAVFVHVSPRLSASSSRVKRQANAPDKIAAAVKAAPTPESLNVGKDYSEMYPVIFNIILWFMIAMGLTIASVAYCIWFMDPGKDGIIYRMTASRIKKDL